jgi:accessory gene regulator B
MLTKLSQIIVDFFVKEDVVSEEQREIYQYGIELSVSTLMGLFIVLAIGVLSRRFTESVIFYIVFCLTRAFCGGFHAHSHLLCKVTFICVLILVLVMDLVLDNIEIYYWFVLYLYSLTIVCAFAPVENPNKRLTSYDKKRCKIISIIFMVVWLVAMILFYSFGSELYHIVALTLFFVANLMLLGKYNKRRETK